MYHFRDTIAFSEYESWIPSSAMIYDNCLFEQEIDGYQTLYVEGREMLSLEFETEKMTVGEFVLTQRLPARTLTVHYKLEDRNPESFQQKFNQLMKRLYRTEDVSIQFNDQRDLTYFGRYESAESVDGKSNSIISSFTIKCADPRKYTREFSITREVKSDLPYGAIPDSITFEATQDKNVRITNGRETISITNSAIKTGDKVEILIKQGKILVNGENKTRILDLTSDFKNFIIKQNDIVKCDNGIPAIKYRGVVIMSESVYFFDADQKLIKIVDESRLFSVTQEKEITSNKEELINDKLSVSTVFDDEIKEANYMAVREDESSFSMYKIIGTADPGTMLIFTGINFGPDELDAYVINDIRPNNEFFQSAIARLLSFTEGDWRVGYLDSTLPAVTATFYYCSVREALKTLQTLGCEILFKCELSGEGITDKWIEVYKQIGEYSNERFEYGDKALTIEKEIDRSNIYTSLIGRGRGEEVGDGYGRRIEFDQVYWSKANGDPLDKPTGKISLEIPEMTELYGIPTKDGKRRKREKVEIFEDCEDPVELIKLTYQALVSYSRPLIQFKTTVFGGDDLGNILTIHRYDRGYHYETRIFSVKIDRLTGKVEAGLGDNLNTSSTRQSSNTQNAIQSLDDKKMTFYESTEVSKWQSDIIRGAKGGSIIMMNPEDTGKGNSREPYQMVWMNGDSIATSNHFLVANSEGIGFIDGKFNEANFKTAWTIDGNFNANYIQSGRIRADIFETSFNDVGDQLKLVKGALQVVNSNNKIMELTKKGMQFWGGNGEIGTIGTTNSAGNPFPDMVTSTPIENNSLVIRSNEKSLFLSLQVKRRGL